MLDNLKEYWYLWLILVLVLILTIFVWYKALKASANRNSRRRMEIEKIDRHRRLRKDFAEITPSLIAQASDQDLLEGTTEHLMEALEKSKDDLAYFHALPEEWKYIYTLTFIKDLAAGDSVRRFYRECGEVLGKYTAPALSAMCQPMLSAFFAKATSVYDENDMTASADMQTIAKLEDEFRKLMENIDFDRIGADFIRSNSQVFIAGAHISEV